MVKFFITFLVNPEIKFNHFCDDFLFAQSLGKIDYQHYKEGLQFLIRGV